MCVGEGASTQTCTMLQGKQLQKMEGETDQHIFEQTCKLKHFSLDQFAQIIKMVERDMFQETLASE